MTTTSSGGGGLLQAKQKKNGTKPNNETKRRIFPEKGRGMICGPIKFIIGIKEKNTYKNSPS
ncbi:MAG: hypothetical protein LBT16_03015 [Treponema sp.]|nr:hypothetical protein [Treponema sp.]